ncbi:sulfatase [Paraurantiacibacter namhicola]|nr:sulfatase [Paraurantiacibacter namhicola]
MTEGRASAGPGEQFPDRPNIILITAEDLSPRMGFMGDEVAVTPNLDALAAESVVFTKTFTTAGVCAPARSALITGVHQTTLGTMHMRTSSYGMNMPEGEPYEAVPPASIKAFPELLRSAGYHTVNRQKTDYQFGEPFTIWDDNDHSQQWPHGLDAEQPFFAMINFPTTHEGRTWPPDLNTSERPNVKNALERNATMDARKNFPPTVPDAVRVPAYYPDTPVVRQNLARHYDNIRLMDQEVGALLRKLEAEGRFDDSIIIFTTDHGDGLPRAKRTIFDSGTHVPLIVRFPNGYGAGERRSELVSFVDLAPTILAFAGVGLPDWIQGRDIFRAAPPQYIYMAGDRFDEVPQRFRGIRSDGYLYIRYFSDKPVIPSLGYQNTNPIMHEWRRLHAEGALTPLQAMYLEAPAPRRMLFDVSADPDNVRNLADDPAYAVIATRMDSDLMDWIARSGDLGRVPEAQMRARMWPGGTQPRTAAPQGCRASDGAVVLTSATVGASVDYGGEQGEAELYARPISATQPFAARAIRYGYAPSAPSPIDPASLQPCG